jgi:hypothetical protein
VSCGSQLEFDEVSRERASFWIGVYANQVPTRGCCRLIAVMFGSRFDLAEVLPHKYLCHVMPHYAPTPKASFAAGDADSLNYAWVSVLDRL